MYEKGVLWLPVEHKKFFRVLVTRHIHMVVHCYLTILTIFLIFDAWEIRFFDRFILNITKNYPLFNQSIAYRQMTKNTSISSLLTHKDQSNWEGEIIAMFTEFNIACSQNSNTNWHGPHNHIFHSTCILKTYSESSLFILESWPYKIAFSLLLLLLLLLLLCQNNLIHSSTTKKA